MDTLILGNGNRARNTIIPALKKLREKFLFMEEIQKKLRHFAKQQDAHIFQA